MVTPTPPGGPIPKTGPQGFHDVTDGIAGDDGGAVPKTGPQGFDASSPVFLVDHAACILCDRCSRACDDVKKNNVIGRTGKGATAAIGFDLDVPMGESSCVQCGECMISCPTSAITFNPDAKVELPTNGIKLEPISVAELIKDPLFADVPPKLLQWQEGVVRRRRIKAGEVLCRQGDPGNIAYVIKSGRVEVTAYFPEAETAKGGLHKLRIKGRTHDVMMRTTARRGGHHRRGDGVHQRDTPQR